MRKEMIKVKLSMVTRGAMAIAFMYENILIKRR